MLKIELKTRIYNTAEQVIFWVEEHFKESYSLRGMQTLKYLGFTYKKNRLMPGKANPEAQRQFVQWFDKVRAELGPLAHSHRSLLPQCLVSFHSDFDILT